MFQKQLDTKNAKRIISQFSGRIASLSGLRTSVFVRTRTRDVCRQTRLQFFKVNTTFFSYKTRVFCGASWHFAEGALFVMPGAR